MVHRPIQVTKKPPVVRAALCVYAGVCYFFTLTGAILTTNRSLIIRTTIRTTIRERLKIGFIWLQVFRPIIGRNVNPSRDAFPIRSRSAQPPEAFLGDYARFHPLTNVMRI